MDMKAFFEETAKQIYKIFLSGSDINTPVVIMLFWTRPTPRVAHPSPLKKKTAEKDIWWSKMELCSTS